MKAVDLRLCVIYTELLKRFPYIRSCPSTISEFVDFGSFPLQDHSYSSLSCIKVTTANSTNEPHSWLVCHTNPYLAPESRACVADG